MDVFLARQPIFDLKQNIYGYEILYRSGNVDNYFDPETDENFASSQVIIDTFQSFGLENITNLKPAFINFPSKLIEQDVATLFPKDYLIIELLENIKVTPDLIKKCKELNTAGYIIALDDFIYHPRFEPLFNFVDIIKVDFVNSSRAQILEVKEKVASRKIKLLAEKIETWDDLHLAKQLGFTMFQGYYFSKPEMLTTSRLNPLEINHFRLLSKINAEIIDFQAIAKIISHDVSLTYNLLKLVNSAAFGVRQRVNSVQQALVMLGEVEMKKWLNLIAFQGLSKTNSAGPISLSLIRARFGENLAKKLGLFKHKEEIFLVGLFSLLDVMLQRPMWLILEELNTSGAVKDAILQCAGPYAPICKLVLSYERGDWNSVEEVTKNLHISLPELAEAYLEAVKWQRHEFEF